MSKGEQTKEAILQQAAQLFTRRGFFGAALSDVMEVTGLEKGGIYNHFESKEDLALQAFDYAVDLVRQEIARAVRDKLNTVDRLLGMMAVFEREAAGYPLAGGCPVMNTAIEADDAHPALRKRAQQAMDEWYEFVRRTVRRGKEKGEIQRSVDPELFSSILISTLEGAVMQSKLYGNVKAMDQAVQYLQQYIERDVRAASD
ncbi:MAG TPA: TetR/AcrR family transcriptional regulator [Anaerolineales bacterium]|jgi:AcrR family transcriptional regulator